MMCHMVLLGLKGFNVSIFPFKTHLFLSHISQTFHLQVYVDVSYGNLSNGISYVVIKTLF